MDDTVAITLFRHGVTEENKRKAYLGWNDSPLCTEATTALAAVATNESAHDLYVTSDLGRCSTTMKLLFPTITAIPFKQFREMHFGKFQGKTYEELKNIPTYKNWLNRMMTAAPPDGESFRTFEMRILNGWDRLIQMMLAKDAKKPFIVTHSGVIRYLLMKFAPIKKEYWDWHVDYDTKYVMTFEMEQLRRRGRCILLQEEPLTEKEHGY